MPSDFFLQPLDGGPRVPVGPGQTVIGRGPLLGITDKRVSRRHAILEVVDSQLRIKPIHRNPCFYQSSKKCRKADQEGPGVSSENVPESSSSNIVKDPDVDIVKTNKQKDGILIEELGEVSKHKAATKPTTNEEGESCARVQSKSPPEKSQGCHPESSSAPSSPDALHTDTADPVLGCSEESKVRRTACMYGANCYRRNPLHFQHFSFESSQSIGIHVSTSPRRRANTRQWRRKCGASCIPGIAFPCYRKNPQHKMEYRHSALPARVALDEDDDDVGQPSDDEDEEDYEPTDEDSDWHPGKDDEEQEDVDELLKEAKRFMRRKK